MKEKRMKIFTYRNVADLHSILVHDL